MSPRWWRNAAVGGRSRTHDAQGHHQQWARRFDWERGQALGSDDLQTGGGVQPPANAGLGDERVEHVVLRSSYGVGEAGVIAVSPAWSVQMLVAAVRSLSHVANADFLRSGCCVASGTLVSSAITLKR